MAKEVDTNAGELESIFRTLATTDVMLTIITSIFDKMETGWK